LPSKTKLNLREHLGFIYVDQAGTVYGNCAMVADKNVSEIANQIFSHLMFHVVTSVCAVYDHPGNVGGILGLNRGVIDDEIKVKAHNHVKKWYDDNKSDLPRNGDITIYMDETFNVFVRRFDETFDQIQNCDKIVKLFEGWNPCIMPTIEPKKESKINPVQQPTTTTETEPVTKESAVSDNKVSPPELVSCDENTLCALLSDCLIRQELLYFDFLVNHFQIEKRPGLPRRLALQFVSSKYAASKDRFELPINNADNKSLMDLLRIFGRKV